MPQDIYQKSQTKQMEPMILQIILIVNLKCWWGQYRVWLRWFVRSFFLQCIHTFPWLGKISESYTSVKYFDKIYNGFSVEVFNTLFGIMSSPDFLQGKFISIVFWNSVSTRKIVFRFWDSFLRCEANIQPFQNYQMTN
jgi:hypothetical protein